MAGALCASDVLMLDPHVIVYLLGTNDAPRGEPEQTANDIHQDLELLQVLYPRATIILLAVLPRGADSADALRLKNEKVNSRIRRFADGRRVHFLDLGPDMLRSDGTFRAGLVGPDNAHPARPGYEVMLARLQAEIRTIH